MTSFDRAVPALAQALSQRGYTELTAVQEAVLAPELRDADILVSAQTGSGKTVAFGLALAPTLLGDAEKFEASAAPLALVVAPTRELALQVRRELLWLYAPTGAIITSCVIGMDFRDERRTLELKSATPVVRSDTADAELEVFLCEVDPDAEVAGVGAQRREPTNICRVFEPVSDGMRFLTGGGEPRHELILRVRTTQPGVVRVEGIEISYRDGLRRGTQVTGADVTVRARAERSRQR